MRTRAANWRSAKPTGPRPAWTWRSLGSRPGAGTHRPWPRFPDWHGTKSKTCDPSLPRPRSEEHTSELQSLMRISYAVFCLKKKNDNHVDALATQGDVTRRELHA